MKRLHLIAAIALAAAAPLALAQGVLDGKKYIGEIGPKGKGVEDTNVVFTFADGRFRSSVCDQYGFERGPYATTKDGDAIRFEAKTVSAEYGTNQWTGTVKGDVVEGVLVWQRKPSFLRPNPEPVEKWFKAKLQ
jgi:hypothetical protein